MGGSKREKEEMVLLTNNKWQKPNNKKAVV